MWFAEGVLLEGAAEAWCGCSPPEQRVGRGRRRDSHVEQLCCPTARWPWGLAGPSVRLEGHCTSLPKCDFCLLSFQALISMLPVQNDTW